MGTWSPDGSYVLLTRFYNVIGTWSDAPGAKIIAAPADFAQTDFVSFEAPPSPIQQVTHPCPQVRGPRAVIVGAPVHHGVRTFKIDVQDKQSLAGTTARNASPPVSTDETITEWEAPGTSVMVTASARSAMDRRPSTSSWGLDPRDKGWGC